VILNPSPLLLHVSKRLAPYAWDDDLWKVPGRGRQSQLAVQQLTYANAQRAIDAVRDFEIRPKLSPE